MKQVNRQTSKQTSMRPMKQWNNACCCMYKPSYKLLAKYSNWNNLPINIIESRDLDKFTYLIIIFVINYMCM